MSSSAYMIVRDGREVLRRTTGADLDLDAGVVAGGIDQRTGDVGLAASIS